MRFGECPARAKETVIGIVSYGKHEPLRPPGWQEDDRLMTLKHPATSPSSLYSIDVCQHCGLLYASDVVLDGKAYP